jgi:hypothetical protein
MLLLFAFGSALFHLDNWLDKKLPDGFGVAAIVTYSLLVSLGVPLAIPLVGSFFSEEFCFCAEPPVWIGVFFIVTALATVTWWFLQLRGAEKPPRWVAITGQTALAMTALAGAFYLGREILAIV